MPFANHILYLNPNEIQINRETRQRREIDVSDIIDSIRENGIINPITVKAGEVEGDLPILIAGERRLEACKTLGLTIIPARFFYSENPLDIHIIELEENHKRKNLPWRDEITTIARLHQAYMKQDSSWNESLTAKKLSLSKPTIGNYLLIYKYINDPSLIHAENITQALSLINRFIFRKQDNLIQDISSIGKDIFSKPITTSNLFKTIKPKLNPDLSFDIDIDPPADLPVLNLDFQSWLNTKPIQKFNLIYHDFNSTNYNSLDFLINLNKNRQILSPRSHLLFWIEISQYNTIQSYLNDFCFLEPPLIWYKSDYRVGYNAYEMAVILSTDFDHLNNISKPNLYPYPSINLDNTPIPEPVLKYFLSMIVDENTTILDPSCGGGHSLKIAEDLGAKEILGLESNPVSTRSANSLILKSRVLR